MLLRLVVSLVLLSAFDSARPVWAGPALLFDVADSRVLYAEDQDDQWHPASLTKIMTAYLTFEAIKAGKLTLETKITCSELAHNQAPSKVGLPVGGEMTVETALQALIVKSANDVAVMLAEAVAGSHEAFVERMNQTAARLGMTRTRFVNASGLPAPEQVTTARDLAKLAIAVVRDYPEYARLWAMVDMQIGKRRLRTHNGLLKTYEGADGLKTGFICDSGYNVVASATREGRRLIAIVLGEASGSERSVRAASLLEHGFQTRDWKALFSNVTLDTLPAVADAKEVTTMKQTLASWACGVRKRARVVAKSRKKRMEAKARQAKEAEAVEVKRKAKQAQKPDRQEVKAATTPAAPR
jgi:D-alanyl-D-alanine carboxypeptidase